MRGASRSRPDPIARRVAAHCARHELLPIRRRVMALVSGGPDSTCLMHLLAELAPERVGVLSLDHGLRPESAGEAREVAQAARALGLPAHVERLGLAAGPGAPARARAARLATAERVAADAGYDRIATGHTASDQAETVLHRLARGAGRTGALGLAPRRGHWIRPLLAVTAAETRAWCAERGLATVADPGNRDPRTRAGVRHGLLPALAAVHPGAERHVAALAELLRDEAELISPLIEAAWKRCHDGTGLRLAALADEPPPLRRLLVRQLLERAGLPPDARAGEPVARLLALGPGGALDLPGGRVAVEGGRLVAHRPPTAPPPTEPVPLAVPGEAVLGGARVRATADVAGAPGPERVAVRPGAPLAVRPPRPGDRLPLPGGGHQAVGRLLAAAGVPARLRPWVPVVASAERVVWVAGHRAAPDLIAPPGAPAVVLALEGAPAPAGA